MSVGTPPERNCKRVACACDGSCVEGSVFITQELYNKIMREKEELKRVLRQHDRWHNEIGRIIIPKGEDTQLEQDVELNLSLEYQDSGLCEDTIKALNN